MEFMPYIAIGIFGISLLGIVFELLDKAVIALLGALLFVLLGILSPEAAIAAIDFETILLLMGMMMLVDIARKSEVFSWLNVRVARLTQGNPLLIMVLFLLITAVFSAFLDNVTTILIVVPVTIALTRGMGLDPKMYVIAEIIFSNIGGAVTLIGDPTNIIVGSAAGLSFNDFIVNLAPPILVSMAVLIAMVVVSHWKQLRPIASDIRKLFLSNLLIRKIEYTFLRYELRKSFVLKTVLIIVLTLVGFALHDVTHIQPHIIALLGATLLLLFTNKYASVHSTLQGVEWPTLIYFAGLFVMVAGLSSTGVLDNLSYFILGYADNFFVMLLVIIWLCGLVSMVLDNVPFVTIMVPVVASIEQALILEPNIDLIWWALALGVVLGGNGTMVGASTNVVGLATARKEGISISFMEYFRVGFPAALVCLTIASCYFFLRTLI